MNVSGRTLFRRGWQNQDNCLRIFKKHCWHLRSPHSWELNMHATARTTLNTIRDSCIQRRTCTNPTSEVRVVQQKTYVACRSISSDPSTEVQANKLSWSVIDQCMHVEKAKPSKITWLSSFCVSLGVCIATLQIFIMVERYVDLWTYVLFSMLVTFFFNMLVAFFQIITQLLHKRSSVW